MPPGVVRFGGMFGTARFHRVGTGVDDGDDPFAGLSLDDDFVRDAKVQEASADDRVERLRRIDDAHRRLIDERRAQQQTAERSARRDRRRPRRLAVVVAFAIAGVIAWSMVSGRADSGSSDLAGVPGLDHPSDAPVGPDLVTAEADIRNVPAPSDEQQEAPLGTPAPLREESSAFRFGQIQRRTAEPVAYDPCRPIHVVHNLKDAPPEADTLLAEALDDVSRATGLQFQLDGETDEAPDLARDAFQPDRYGDRWAPVLIGWSDAAEVSELAGDAVGVGGSAWLEVDDTAGLYVTGAVVLDAPDLREVDEQRGGRAVGAVIRHELAHVVGLDHVDDAAQLMHPIAQPDVDTFGAGDLAGLARLGAGACFPEV